MRTPGSYILLLFLPASATLQVGRLGTFAFARGFYLYSGSALGGLEGRVGRHFRPPGLPRWHVDYLRERASLLEAWCHPSPHREECWLARAALALPQAVIPVPGFGSSDCSCPSHLAYLPFRPSLSAFQGKLRELLGPSYRLYIWRGE